MNSRCWAAAADADRRQVEEEAAHVRDDHTRLVRALADAQARIQTLEAATSHQARIIADLQAERDRLGRHVS